MATWWKKLLYSKWLKGLAVIGSCLVSFLLLFSFFSYQIIPHQDSVYKTDFFKEEMIRKAGFVRDFIVRYRNDEVISTITDQDIENYRQLNNTLTEEAIKKQIAKDRMAYQKEIDNALGGSNKNVDFYAKSLKDEIVITNMDSSLGEEKIMEELRNRKLYLIGDGHYIYERSGMLSDYTVRGSYPEYSDYQNVIYPDYYAGDSFLGESDYLVVVALKDELVPGDVFYFDAESFKGPFKLKVLVDSILPITLGASILLIIYWFYAAGRSKNEEGIKLNQFDKCFLEIQLAGLGIITVFFFILMQLVHENSSVFAWLPYINEGDNTSKIAIGSIIFILVSLLTCSTLAVVTSLIKHIKNKSMKSYIGILQLGKYLIKTYTNEKTAAFLCVGLLVCNFIVSIVSLWIADYLAYQISGTGGVLSYAILLITWNIVLSIGLFRVMLDYKRILKGAKAIEGGKLESKIQLKGSLTILEALSDTINTIGTGLEKAVAESVRSERLKAELITNVSHDLKTPLTSIISYIDLLKAEPIDNEVAKEYIGILDERSGRLKHLVEDLVEASKAVTGNVEAKLEPVMLDELVQQAIGEYTDRLEAQNLQIMQNKLEPTWVLADGRHMWRVIENLLSNVYKYAMPHTRAYIEVTKGKEKGVLTIKNISKEALDIDPSELTERFVRGDSSRSTEGSGLGLAIAQSLVELQAGTMTINIDGDLFKVEIKLPLADRGIVLGKE